MDFQLRPLTRADEPFLWDMLYEAVFVPPGEPRPPREIVQQPELACYVQGWGRAGDLGFLAVHTETGTPAGATWLRLWGGAERGYGYVDDRTSELSVAVLPEYRGQGLGTRLLQQLLQEARDRFPAVSLSVSSESRAVVLYRRLGFQVLSEDETGLTMYLFFGDARQGGQPDF